MNMAGANIFALLLKKKKADYQFDFVPKLPLLKKLNQDQL